MGRYIGITGFRTPQEIEYVHCLAESISECAAPPTIGYGMVFYLQNRQLALSLGELQRLFSVIESLGVAGKAIVHLNEWGDDYRPIEQALKLAEIVSPHVSIQVNKYNWESQSLSLIKQVFPHSQFILPYNPYKEDLVECFSLIERHFEAVESILIDASEGNGKPCDVAQVTKIIKNLRTNFPKLPLGIAGGLGTGTSKHLVSHLHDLAPVSVDAETGLWRNDELVVRNVTDYLKAMITLSS